MHGRVRALAVPLPYCQHCQGKCQAVSKALVDDRGVLKVLPLDQCSRGAILEADLGKFYDNLDWVSFAEFFESFIDRVPGLSRGLVCAMIRFQMLPRVGLKVLGIFSL